MNVSISLFLFSWTAKSMGFCPPEFEEREESKDLIWIAKSHIQNFDDLEDFTTANLDKEPMYIEIPQWVAENKGIDTYCEELENEAR